MSVDSFSLIRPFAESEEDVVHVLALPLHTHVLEVLHGGWKSKRKIMVIYIVILSFTNGTYHHMLDWTFA